MAGNEQQSTRCDHCRSPVQYRFGRKFNRRLQELCGHQIIQTVWQAFCQVMRRERDLVFDVMALGIGARIPQGRLGNINGGYCPALPGEPDGVITLAAAKFKRVANRPVFGEAFKDSRRTAAGL